MYQSVIGLEIHAQLLTKTKLFCSCSTNFGEPPNKNVCPVCLGLPGALPVLNEEVVNFSIKLALALNMKINLISRFSRKNYFYPDLPKGYQITQYDLPLAVGGYLELDGDRKVVIERINLEEDAGKSIHDGMPDSNKKTYLDFNRSGIPLIEIVTKPEIYSPEEAVQFVMKLRLILQYLEICDGNMEEGSLRCDANVSQKKIGKEELGTKTEIKNLNSFKFLHKALEYEIKRQEELLNRGEKIFHETRLYDSSSGKTFPMRSKEEAHDYRYFPEPDLLPLRISKDRIQLIKSNIPELPDSKRKRFREKYGIPSYDCEILTSSRLIADYFEETVKYCKMPKNASNWIMGEVLRYLNDENIDFNEFKLPPEYLAELIIRVENGEIPISVAKEIFPLMAREKKRVDEILQEKKIELITDDERIREIIEEVFKENPLALKQLKEGKTQVISFLIGQVLKKMERKGNPNQIKRLLEKVLNEKHTE
ncbi:MAG: Asp-tRNA(Asn)/Glu-tRNA(Gln) amidotransferase subunit GatB [Acidobacteriota bacterium]